MPNLSDGVSLDDLSRNESIKAASNHLRGLIKEELVEDTPAFTDDSEQLLKFHGIYQQDDRDRRKEARARGLDKATTKENLDNALKVALEQSN